MTNTSLFFRLPILYGISILPAICFALLFPACASKALLLDPADLGKNYFYEVNLNDMENDRLAVRLSVYGIKANTVDFNFPRIVPGIYGAMDFGRNIVHLRAFAGADTLPVERTGINTWKISRAYQLDEIRYEVNDGWEVFGSGTTEGFYKSAESSFTKDTVFVINNNCLFGYFTGGENWPVFVSFEKPDGFYAATSLRTAPAQSGKDAFQAANYRELVDNPILYARPDTVNLNIGNTVVTIACYADSGVKLAPDIAAKIRPLLEQQREYLGGALPVEHYTFLIYHSLLDRPDEYTADGLEHNTSTLCLYNSQMAPALLNSFVYGVASHEFFHIITPLNVHSEEIERYDFLAPKMSQHLWMYEGMTEYTTMHMPIRQGLEPLDDFLSEIRNKVQQMQRFDNTIPLTELSRAAMDRQDQYYNFYLRGALVCLCLDLRLRELSQGKYGTQELMRDLAARYGRNKPFKDEELFDVITSMTFPEIRGFFSDYLENARPLPLKAYLEKAGLRFNEKSLNIQASSDATPEQLQLRKWWLGR